MSCKTVELGDVIELQNGYSFKSLEYTDNGYFLMRITNVQQGYISNHNPKYVSIHETSNLKQFIISEGDILMSLTGDVGRVGIIEKHNLPAALNQRVARIIIKTEKGVDKNYIFNLLNSEIIRKEIENFAHGAAQLNVSTKDICSIKVPLPPLATQQKIVAKLDAIFAEIDKATAAAEANTRNAEALFYSYLTKVFNDIAIKYEKYNVSDVLKLEYGKGLDDADRDINGIYAAYGANGIKSKTNKFLHDKPSIIIGRKGSAGELTLVNEKFWALDVTYYVTHDEKKSNLYYLYYALKMMKLTSLAKGIKPGINRNDVYKITIALPSLEEQKSIVNRIEDICKNVETLRKSYVSKKLELENLKQSILKQAFNGELVKE
jgi:type I restriction enzyme S subunit